MSVRVLSDAEARDILLRHPEIQASRIPSYGLRFYDEETNKDYLAGIVHATGEVRLIDVTMYDESGQRIDQDVALSSSQRQALLIDLAKYFSDPYGIYGRYVDSVIDYAFRIKDFVFSSAGSKIFFGGIGLLAAAWLILKAPGRRAE